MLFKKSKKISYKGKLLKAKKSEKNLISFYKLKYKSISKLHNDLYNQHLKNLEELDSSLPQMKSLKKIFINNIPNDLKPKKYNEKALNKYLKNDILNINNYDTGYILDEIDFIKYHIKLQIYSIIYKYFKTMMQNIRNYRIYLVNDESLPKSLKNRKKSRKKSKRTIDDVDFDDDFNNDDLIDNMFKKKSINKKTNKSYRNNKTLKFKLSKLIKIEVIFTLNNGIQILKNLNHKGYYCDKREIFSMVKEVIIESNKDTKVSVTRIIKEKEKEINKQVEREQNEKLVNLLSKKVDNSTELEKELAQKLNEPKFKSRHNIDVLDRKNKSSRLEIKEQIQLQTSDDQSKKNVYTGDPFGDDSNDIDLDLKKFLNQSIKPDKSKKSNRSKKSKKSKKN
tara:strand:- start:538 stop:1719 length:1182 start_codon:yes stop_codon:yes gene_type:complete